MVNFSVSSSVTDLMVRFALRHPSTGDITELLLEKFDAVKIPPGMGHKVIGGSDDNSVMVSCDPYFVPGDEMVSQQLEEQYSQPLPKLAIRAIPDREILKKLIHMKTLINDFTDYMRRLNDYTCGSSEYASEWRNIYSTSKFIAVGEGLSKKLTSVQEQSLDSVVDSVAITNECKEYFDMFFREMRSGEIIQDPHDSDGLIDTGRPDGRREHTFEVIAKLQQEVERDWKGRIRTVLEQ